MGCAVFTWELGRREASDDSDSVDEVVRGRRPERVEAEDIPKEFRVEGVERRKERDGGNEQGCDDGDGERLRGDGWEYGL
jgi:hypothetical protein